MPPFRVHQIDHVELFVPDRFAAALWYERVLGLQIVPEYQHWATNPSGPLMIATAEGGTKLALFTGPPQGQQPTVGFHLVAFRVSRTDFEAFRAHLRDNPVHLDSGELSPAPPVRDHGAALSIYFNDPYGHHFEVTTYDIA